VRASRRRLSLMLSVDSGSAPQPVIETSVARTVVRVLSDIPVDADLIAAKSVAGTYGLWRPRSRTTTVSATKP
jgi:hypothetical protein